MAAESESESNECRQCRVDPMRIWGGCCGLGALSSVCALVLVALARERAAFFGAYENVDARVLAIQDGAKACCDIVACACAQADPGVPTCAQAASSGHEGACGNGPACCTGLTCGMRAQNYDVANEGCTVKCGTCYRPSLLFAFALNGALHTATQTLSACVRDNTACVRSQLNGWSVNATRLLHVLKSDLSYVVAQDLVYEASAQIKAGLVLCSALLLVALCMMACCCSALELRSAFGCCCCCCWCCCECKGRCKNDNGLGLESAKQSDSESGCSPATTLATPATPPPLSLPCNLV